MTEDLLENAAYERDPSLFWLWPERWIDTPVNKATQKFEAFWRFIPRAVDWIRVKGFGGSIGADLCLSAGSGFAGLLDGDLRRNKARNRRITAENLAKQRYGSNWHLLGSA